MPPMTRGPLPAGVYWRRRLFVLALAATMVFVIGNVLSGGSDGKDDAPAARQVSGETTPSQTITVKERKKHGKGKRRNTGAVQGPTFDPTILVDPQGNCEPADVRITPVVSGAVAGRPVTIGLNVRTVQADACYFRIGSDKVTVKITKGGREIWSSRECPEPIPSESIVVRRVVATLVQMTWDAHESDSSCSHRRQWLMPGKFSISTSALGGEPAGSEFDLAAPVAETVTITPHPHRHPKGDKGDNNGAGGDQGQQDDATGNPSDTSTNEPRR
ncbi:hypothetical protein F0U44_14115 [Nocardioides humilatus]|uniref:DUF4232 domain-containing protein n=1 Tax=Nocardioides humilatus TaxID=2607660 RepID=A0A5B1LGM5_9ACTN|nr:hypothetical protein [Nocardioides humilatus]KAA1419556.1 hypothetical protein F0U44_14115 [Nocardioides humilatus]